MGIMTGSRRHVDWVLADADTEKELVVQAPNCESVPGNHKKGEKPLGRERLQTSMQI